MVATQTVTEALIEKSIVRSVGNVFLTMVRQEARLVDKTSVPPPPGPETKPSIIGSVGFVGAANGLIYLCLTEDFAIRTTAQILGMSEPEVRAHGYEVINDAIGEVTNMMVGGFKNALCDVGFPCKLTLPTMVRGNHVSVAAVKAATRHIFLFSCSGFPVIADIQLKSE